MKTNYLFPNKYKKIGWIILIPTIIIGIITFGQEPEFLDRKVFSIFPSKIFTNQSSYFSIINDNILNEIIAIFLILSLILVSFSKEKEEDEMISKIRMKSLVWAVYVNYGILFFTFFTIYGLSFLNVMLYNMFTPLLFFIIHFNFKLWKLKKTS